MTNLEDKNRKYDLENRLLDFSVHIIDIVEALPNSRAASHIENQLVRSGTAPTSNYGEAQSAESRNDFIHKMKIALKELRETYIWLSIIERKMMIKSRERLKVLINECNELTSIFVASVKTAKRNKILEKTK
jgi:four helix bundle protein